MTDVAPCRKCGSNAEICGDHARPDDGYRFVRCVGMGCDNETTWQPSEREAVNVWNDAYRYGEPKPEATGNASTPALGISEGNETQNLQPKDSKTEVSTPESEVVTRLGRVRSTGARKGKLWNPDGPDAAAIIERQAAEIARLKGALPQSGEPSPVQTEVSTDLTARREATDAIKAHFGQFATSGVTVEGNRIRLTPPEGCAFISFDADDLARALLPSPTAQGESLPAREAREALEFYASNFDWHPGDGEAPDATFPGSAPTYYEATANDDLNEDGGQRAIKALKSLAALTGTQQPDATPQADVTGLVAELREELKVAISPQWHPLLAARVDCILRRMEALASQRNGAGE